MLKQKKLAMVWQPLFSWLEMLRQIWILFGVSVGATELFVFEKLPVWQFFREKKINNL